MTTDKLTVGSLFAGIGGIDLGLEDTGYYKTIWQVENNPYCQQILTKHFREALKFSGVTEFNDLISSLGGSRVKTSQSPASEQDSLEPEADSGLSSSGAFAYYDRRSCSWKTSQGCLVLTGAETLDEFSGTWPRAGMMRNGIAYQQPPLVPRTSVTGCSLLPTPRAIYGDHPGMKDPRHLTGAIHLFPTPAARDYRSPGTPERLTRAMQESSRGQPLTEAVGGKLNPTWVEWLMGFPLGWTAFEPSETQSCPPLPGSSDEE